MSTLSRLIQVGDGSDFDYNPDIVKIIDGKAQLTLTGEASSSFVQEYSFDPGTMIYDPTKLTFFGGKLQQLFVGGVYPETYASLPVWNIEDDFSYGVTIFGEIQRYILLTSTASPEINYVIDGKYWNGSAWVASDLSYAQSSTVAAINANLATLTPSSSFRVTVVFPQSTGSKFVDSTRLSYTGQSYPYVEGSQADFAITTKETYHTKEILSAQVLGDNISTRGYFTLEVDGVPYWFTGGAWQVSNENYLNYNDYTTFINNIASFDASAGIDYRIKCYLYRAFADTRTYSAIGTSFMFTPIAPDFSKTIIYGFAKNLLAEIPAEAAVKIHLSVSKPFILNGHLLYNEPVIIECDADGYIEKEVIPTGTQKLKWEIEITGLGKYLLGYAVVPDQESLDITTITFSKTR